jgi:predicted MFS family arabinose efflux permease
VEAQRVVESMDTNGNRSGSEPQVSWQDFKAAVDRSAEVIDKRVLPISASLLLNYSGQGATAPILPLLSRSLGLTTADVGLVAASSALARVLTNIPASALADKIGRRPLLIAGPGKCCCLS